MKIILCILVMTASGVIGISFKLRIKKRLEFFMFLKDFAEFVKSNITLFKVNLVQIIDEFILLQNEKNANFLQIFRKNGQIYAFDENFVLKHSEKKENGELILRFLTELGKNDYEFERTRLDEFLKIIGTKIEEENLRKKTQGDLYFKLSLGIGAVISIIIW